jgi:tetratricopeptide (TPR) repeat protein
MIDTPSKIQEFVHFVRCLEGSEMRDAQTFYDRLFQAFGHNGWFDSGAQIEYPIKSDGEHTKFADLVWRPRLLLEMKSRGKKLEKYHKQVFSYWNALTSKPRYVVLCNFDEFWIYDTLVQIEEPVNFVKLEDLPKKYDALNFLFPGNLGFNADNEIISYDNIPPNGVLQFVGREEELKKLDELLQQQNGRKIAVIVGMGGVGKTEFAKQYALRHLQNCRENKANISTGGVCWLDGREGDIAREIVSFARSFLNLKPPEDWDIPTQLNYCWRNWRTGEWLMVIDDVTDYGKIKPYLPPESSNFTILITRREKLGRSFAHLPLETLEPQPALDLLKSLVGAERIEQELEIAEKICSWLGYLPLVLELVGRYLDRDPDLSLKTMFSLLEKKRLRHKSITEADATMTAKLGVNDAFELSWERLDENAQELGCILSLFALADIPWELVIKVYKNSSLPENEEINLDIVEESRGDLLDFNLLERRGERIYKLHPLIREFLREKREKLPQNNDIKGWFVSTMFAVAVKLPTLSTELQIQEFTPNVPHIEAVAKDKNLTDIIINKGIAPFFVSLGIFYKNQCLYDQAETWFDQCLLLTQARFGKNHLDVVRSLTHLAAIYQVQGRYKKAELTFIAAINLKRDLLDDDDYDVADIITNLATIYQLQGRYVEAESVCLEALRLKERLEGKEHLGIVISLSNLAAIYYHQGRYREAERFYLEALKLKKILVNKDQTDNAQILINLGILYESQNRLEEAKTLFLQALEINKSLRGDKHPNVALNLLCLGNLYESQGRYSKAEALYKQSLELRIELLGEEHPDVATSLNNLAYLYQKQNRYNEAESLHQRALEVRKHLLGENHPDVAQSLINLAMLYLFKKEIIKAKLLSVKALEIYQQRLGLNHPDTVNCQEFLAIIQDNLKSTKSKLPDFQPKSKKGNSQNKPKGFGKK